MTSVEAKRSESAHLNHPQSNRQFINLRFINLQLTFFLAGALHWAPAFLVRLCIGAFVQMVRVWHLFNIIHRGATISAPSSIHPPKSPTASSDVPIP